MNLPKVSIIIPTYNGERFIGEAIGSVLKQTFSDYELIIRDDNSKDNTVKIAKSFVDPRIKFYCNIINLGMSANYNRCIELSKGDYITILNQDDVMLPTNLEKKVQLLDEHRNVGMVHSNIYQIDEKGKVIAEHWERDHLQDFVINGFSFFERLLLKITNPVCAPSVMVRRECYERLGGFDLSPRIPFTVDLEMWMRIALHYDIAYLSKPLICYRWHANNYTHEFTSSLKAIKQDYLARRIVIERNLKRLKDSNTLLKKVKQKIGELSLNKANAYYEKKSYILGLKHLYFAIKINPPIIKSWLFKFVLIKTIFGHKGIIFLQQIKIQIKRIFSKSQRLK